jgi:hypothetical protein
MIEGGKRLEEDQGFRGVSIEDGAHYPLGL